MPSWLLATVSYRQAMRPHNIRFQSLALLLCLMLFVCATTSFFRHIDTAAAGLISAHPNTVVARPCLKAFSHIMNLAVVFSPHMDTFGECFTFGFAVFSQ